MQGGHKSINRQDKSTHTTAAHTADANASRSSTIFKNTREKTTTAGSDKAARAHDQTRDPHIIPERLHIAQVKAAETKRDARTVVPNYLPGLDTTPARHGNNAHAELTKGAQNKHLHNAQ